MKTLRNVAAPLYKGLGVLLTCGWAGMGFAQIAVTSPIPVVTIQATTPLATWTGSSGAFTLFRAGPTNFTLNVFYLIGGTATNGVDYKPIGNWAIIPAGSGTNSVQINPINLGQTDIRTVILKLAPSPLMIPVNYEIGSPSQDTVFIVPPGVTNVPPQVAIATPASGATFYTPVDIPMCAAARDLDGFVATVEFFANGNSLGIKTNNPLSASPVNPFCLIWSNAPGGAWALTAKATDNGGASTLSDPVNINVLPGPPPPPPTNIPPVVRIVSPPNGALFHAPVDIPIFAYAADPDGLVTGVEFFAGTTDLGAGRPICAPLTAGGLQPMIVCRPNVFVLVWSNAPTGAFALTAVASDNGGASTVSPPVKIAILPSPPPPTNRPPLVSIVATDPIAIEGTNCWPWIGLAAATPTWSSWTATAPICQFFTNCGPKNATFAVRRFGDTNSELVISYSIGGTATNGVDYVPLPGTVTIPAGERRALITVVPLDDGPPDINSTVILRLTPSANSPPDYLVGFPPAAAALILDTPWPPPLTGLLPDKCFHLSSTGPDGAWFHVEASSDLLNWTPICTNQVVSGAIDFIDPDAVSAQTRFYRAVPELSPPTD